MNRIRKFKESIFVSDIAEHFNMEIVNEGNIDFEIKTPSIYQIGYELIGFFDEDGDELNKYLHVYGKKEAMFVDKLSSEKKADMWNKYFTYNFPALIITCETKVTKEMIEAAKKIIKLF